MIWRCPRCRGELEPSGDRLRCAPCGTRFGSVDGIPDLRLAGASWIDRDADTALARELAATAPEVGAEELARRVFGARPGWDEAQIELRTRQVTEAPDRLRLEVTGWLDQSTTGSLPFLDLGCGPGALLAAAAAEGRSGIGVDVSMAWLVVARRLIAEWGGQPVLAAGLAEALPLEAGAVSGVVSLDVIEHVADPVGYLSEIDRVTGDRGTFALSTPNRYSLAAEPHVSLWGVGWLPRPLQARYVAWRGKDYSFVRLLGARELAGLLGGHTRFRFTILVPPVAAEEIARFPRRRAALARLYNRLISLPGLRRLFALIGAFFRVVGGKAS